MAKKNTSEAVSASFEEAMAELEQLVAKMEAVGKPI